MCQDTNGSFICSCNSGFSGNGFTCSSKLLFYHISYPFITHADINECDSTPCDVNAMCQNTNGSFVCACNSGFSGNGFTCSSKLLFTVSPSLISLKFMQISMSVMVLHVVWMPCVKILMVPLSVPVIQDSVEMDSLAAVSSC